MPPGSEIEEKLGCDGFVSGAPSTPFLTSPSRVPPTLCTRQTRVSSAVSYGVRRPRSNYATLRVTNLTVLGTNHFQGIKQVFEGLHRSGAKVDRESDAAVGDFRIGEEVDGPRKSLIVLASVLLEPAPIPVLQRLPA